MLLNSGIVVDNAEAVRKETFQVTDLSMEENDTELFDMTEEEENRMLRKLDLHIFPVVMALYILSFLDRVNIGNARLYRMEADLGLKGNDFQLCVSMLFITYVAFEVPATLTLKIIQPRRLIPLLAVSWGTVALCTGFVQTKAQLVALRLLLGACEAGFFPSVCLYLTFFYRRRELARRTFYLFAASAIAGSCGGLVAFGVGHMDGVAGLGAWRWLMIIEGIPTVLIGAASYFVLANDPCSAPYLTERERALVAVRRKLDGGDVFSGMEDDVSSSNSDPHHHGRIDWQQCREAWRDWKVWTLALGELGVLVMLYSYSVFLPTIINALGYGGIHTQLLTIPCYALGALAYLAVATASDRTGRRGAFVVGGCLAACAGYAVLLGTGRGAAAPAARYAGCVVVAAGLYVATGLPVAWIANNLPSHYKRAAGQGTLLALGNCAGVFAPFIYRTQDKPGYVLGHSVTLGFVFCSGCLFGVTAVLLRRENRKRDRGERDHVLEGKTAEEILRLGDKHPEYRYMY